MSEDIQTKDDLRKFGLTLAGAFTVILGLVPPLLFDMSWHIWPFALTSGLALWAVVAPASLQLFFTLWMKLALAINAVTSRIILGLVFYVMITPMGLAMRWISGDPMKRKFDPEIKSYRVTPKAKRYKNMETPF